MAESAEPDETGWRVGCRRGLICVVLSFTFEDSAMKIRLLLALLLLSTGALAQSGQPIKQSGNVTPGHLPAWVTSGVQGDGGTASD
ncbi:MAG TPA: hypothetical protein VMS08_02775, partial [Candidatus Saccharimonadia bacterium]|nr:hypothetical protein [Candidatus Saccharimonadia bacterium]